MGAHAILVVDTTGVIRMWSPGAERLFGYDTASAIGSTLDLIIPETYRRRHWAAFHPAMLSGKLKQGAEQLAGNLSVLCRDGRVVEFSGRFILLKDGREQVAGAMGIFAASDGADSTGPPPSQV